MSAGKHRGLARRTANLRLAASHGDTGFSAQSNGATPLHQTSWPSRKQVTCATPATPSASQTRDLHDDHAGWASVPSEHPYSSWPGLRLRFPDPSDRPAESPQRREGTSYRSYRRLHESPCLTGACTIWIPQPQSDTSSGSDVQSGSGSRLRP